MFAPIRFFDFFAVLGSLKLKKNFVNLRVCSDLYVHSEETHQFLTHMLSAHISFPIFQMFILCSLSILMRSLSMRDRKLCVRCKKSQEKMKETNDEGLFVFQPILFNFFWWISSIIHFYNLALLSYRLLVVFKTFSFDTSIGFLNINFSS